MPGRKRMYLPGLPYHIVQRGNNREVCFVESMTGSGRRSRISMEYALVRQPEVARKRMIEVIKT